MELRSIETIVKALNNADVQCLVVVGLAVSVHGYERFTKAVDLVIGLARENIICGLPALPGVWYQLRIPVTPEQLPARHCVKPGAGKPAAAKGSLNYEA